MKPCLKEILRVHQEDESSQCDRWSGARASLGRSIPLDRLSPVLGEADADKRECFDFTTDWWRGFSSTGTIRYSTVTLSILFRIPFVRALVYHHTCCPAIVPYA